MCAPPCAATRARRPPLRPPPLRTLTTTPSPPLLLSPPQLLKSLYAATPNVTYVFAAGNEGSDVDANLAAGAPVAYPAAFSAELDNVIGAAATTLSDTLVVAQAPGGVASNYGKTLITLAAPAEDVIGPAFFYYANATYQVYQATYGL